MLSPEIVKKIKQIEIHTKRLLSGLQVGDFSSARKGSGFEFDQIRDYQMGDDVRYIDWRSTARTGKLLMKQYIEERDRTVIIVVDVSSSSLFSSAGASKFDVMAQVAAVLALVADYGKDHASLVLFSDDIDVVIPPNRGKKHIHTLMRQVFSHNIERKKTDLSVVLKYLAGLRSKDALVFFISDFIDSGYERFLQVVAKKYDFIALRCLDANEVTFPDVGFLTMQDIETGRECVVDTRNRAGVAAFLQRRTQEQAMLFKKHGIDYLDIAPQRPFIGDVIQFFRRRMMY
jgi:uncharacterized protein (DUF58 family)